MNKNEANQFIEDCKNGEIGRCSAFMKKFYKPSSIMSMIIFGFDTDEMRAYAANNALKQVCLYNHLDILKVMFSNEDFQHCLDMDRDYASYFRNACDKGFTEIVKFLLQDSSVLVKPDINAGNPVINKRNIKPDYAARSMLGSGTPLSLASMMSHNDLIEVLLDKKANKQKVHEVTIEKSFKVCLNNNNVVGARIIKNNTDVLNTIIKDVETQNEQDNNGALLVELYSAITNGKKEIEDFLVYECSVSLNECVKEINPQMYALLSSYFLKDDLETSLIKKEDIKRKVKI